MPIEITENKQEELTKLCEKFYVSKLSVFGSTLRGEAREDSDLDILVEFIPGHVPGFAFIDLQDKLTVIFGRKVDLRTTSELSKYFRDTVVKEAQPIYAHG